MLLWGQKQQQPHCQPFSYDLIGTEPSSKQSEQPVGPDPKHNKFIKWDYTGGSRLPRSSGIRPEEARNSLC